MIGFQLFLYTINDETKLNYITMSMSLFSQGTLAIVSLYMLKRYYGTQVFGKSYIFLFSGIMSVLVGDLSYNILLLFDYDPTLSISDIFFLGFYACMSLHLYFIIKNFKKKFDKKDFLIMLIVVFAILSTYSLITFNETQNFILDFYYKIFITCSAIVAAFAFFGIRVLIKIPLGRSWLIITIGILVGTISDVWFLHAITFELFTLSHESNQLWHVSYFIILYGLYKTTKAT